MSDDEEMEQLMKRIRRRKRKRKKTMAAIDRRLKRVNAELSRDVAADETEKKTVSSAGVREKQMTSLPFLGQTIEVGGRSDQTNLNCTQAAADAMYAC